MKNEPTFVDLTDNPAARTVFANQLANSPVGIGLTMKTLPNDPTMLILDSIYTKGIGTEQPDAYITIVNILRATADKLVIEIGRMEDQNGGN